jgi:hypothetical protein
MAPRRPPHQPERGPPIKLYTGQRSSTNPVEQSWHRKSTRIAALVVVTRPTGATSLLRQCGHSRMRVSFGGGWESGGTDRGAAGSSLIGSARP